MFRQLINAWKADNLLQQAWDESFEMLEICRQMFDEAMRILRESDDRVVKHDIGAKDIAFNKYQRDVRRKVMALGAVQGPSDLPAGMVLVSTVIDIERIGDYCKNILDLARFHPDRLKAADYEPALMEIEAQIKARFGDTIDVLKNQDVERGRDLMRVKEEVSSVCGQIVEEAVRGNIGDLGPGNNAALALYVRYLKRISSHLNNLVTGVVNPFERIGFSEKKPKRQA